MTPLLIRTAFLALALGLVAEWPLALARQINHREENEWTSTQKSSLGNIGMLSENFVDQFFADPSMQTRKKHDFDLQLASTNIYFTDDFNKTRQDTDKLITELQSSSNSNGSGLEQGLGILDFVASLTGRRVEVGGSIQLFAFRVKGFSLVPHVNAFSKGHIDVPSWPEAEVIVDQYSALGVGYSHPLGKKASLGLNLRPGLRIYIQKELSASSIETGSSSSSSSVTSGFSPRMGLYIPIDMGFGYQLSDSFRANLVARNVYGGAVSNLSPSTDSGQPAAPPDYPLHLSVGGIWDLMKGKTNRLRMATDLQDTLGITSFDDLLLRWQWGFQYLYNLSFRDRTTFGLNAGLQSGYPAIGALLDLYLVKFEAAYFVFEGGASPGQDPVAASSYRLFSEISF